MAAEVAEAEGKRSAPNARTVDTRGLSHAYEGFHLSDECRHGLANGVCDACFPKARPEAPVTPPSTRASRARTATLSRKAAAEASELDLGAQRVYHVTHLDNLAGILADGLLKADTAGAGPAVDISSPHAREARRTITVDDEGNAVADYVPFFLSPTSTAWGSVRTASVDPRLVTDAPATDFVLLVSSVKAVAEARAGESQLVVSDRDATHPLARFATAPDAGDRMLRRLNADLDSPSILEAEFLVKESVPFELVTVITVANDRARNTVKELLRGSAYNTRVAIHPPWFSGEVV